MLGWLRSLFSAAPPRTTVRALEAAKTTRTNVKHWNGVGVAEADQAIIPNLETTRLRCRHEIRENGHAAGIVRTYANDLLGRSGPTPQVRITPPLAGALQLADEAQDDFAEFAERTWERWCETADAGRRMHYSEILAQNVKQFFACGEYLYQRVSDRKAKGVQLRLLTIAPERLGTPWSLYSNTKIRGGVEIDEIGAPLAYHILDSHPGSMFGQMRSTTARRIDAAEICHVYLCEEPGQTRGEPWLGPVLEDFIQLRDFISDTVVAARIAATLGAAFIHTKHPQAQFQSFENQELPILDIEAGVGITLPEGWEATQMRPEHPASTYSEFVKSRLAALGRPIGMPYLRVACDASGHNYSSARLDLQTYWIGIGSVQGFLERRDINPTFRAVIAEEALRVGRRVPEYEISWTWPPIPSIDQEKEATAQTIRLKNGTTTLAKECNNAGDDWEHIQEQQKRERDNAEQLGIPYAPDALNAPAPATVKTNGESDSTAGDGKVAA